MLCVVIIQTPASHPKRCCSSLNKNTSSGPVAQIPPVIKSLHWLLFSQRTKFKILLLVYKAPSGLWPRCMIGFLKEHLDPSGHLELVVLCSKYQAGWGFSIQLWCSCIFGSNLRKIWRALNSQDIEVRAANIIVHCTLYSFFLILFYSIVFYYHSAAFKHINWPLV